MLFNIYTLYFTWI